MDMNPVRAAASDAALVASSIFASDDEQETAQRLLAVVEAGASDAPTALDELKLLAQDVESRQHGFRGDWSENRQQLDESISQLEERLVREIKDRKEQQARDAQRLLAAVICSGLATMAAAAYILVFAADSDAYFAAAAVLVLASTLSLCLIFARLFQNTREALERLDEKIVAVRFLRMALHPNWTGSESDRLLGPAVAMFAQHFAPTSQTLGTEDMSQLGLTSKVGKPSA
ncbi:hypothetical protein ACFWUU_36530 [Kribbella sp. NPDC058693]|uniref:hypothetical protein n=1 Tax=Kribbella sp. NPDC058693 TaxID=3346602 RepID=UPI003658EBA4